MVRLKNFSQTPLPAVQGVRQVEMGKTDQQENPEAGSETCPDLGKHRKGQTPRGQPDGFKDNAHCQKDGPPPPTFFPQAKGTEHQTGGEREVGLTVVDRGQGGRHGQERQGQKDPIHTRPCSAKKPLQTPKDPHKKAEAGQAPENFPKNMRTDEIEGGE